MSHESSKTPAELRFDNEQLRKALHRSTVTLRDQFAIAALQGIMANPERWKQIADDYKSGKKTYEQCSSSNATKAYSIADAMLAAREAK